MVSWHSVEVALTAPCQKQRFRTASVGHARAVKLVESSTGISSHLNTPILNQRFIPNIPLSVNRLFDILIGMSCVPRCCNPVLHPLVALVVSVSLLPNLTAQFIQQGGKLIGAGAVGTPWQGT